MEKSKSEMRTMIIIILGAIMSIIISLFVLAFIAIGILFLSSVTAKIHVNTDVSKYQNYIGANAEEVYKNKWGMDESIFPQTITEDMNVKDYKMVYYDPWDAQYLSYLVAQYDEAEYEKELARLKDYPSTEYRGLYGAKEFDEQYQLIAMNADEYNGFVYALTDKKDTIIYVEIIFCNYFMDLDYKKYIEEKFLPVGFDATSDNPYLKQMMMDSI